MKKRKDHRLESDDDHFRGSKKTFQKSSKNLKKEIFEEIEEEEDIDEYFNHYGSNEDFDDLGEDEEEQ